MRVLRVLLASALVLTAVVGAAHTRAGRPLLVWMGAVVRHAGGTGGCPLGYDRAATPAQKEAARARFAVSHGGTVPAPLRPALGFALDTTRRSDVTGWASSHGLTCAPGKGPADLSCTGVPDSLLPAAFRGMGTETLWFVFGAEDRLIALTAIGSARRPEAVSATFTSLTRDLDGETGAPARIDQDPSAAGLASGLLHQATAEYRFRDYYAVARETNTGSGYALTQEYHSLPD
jgi:hypothetical protein